ncbi:ATP-binding cassette domain-containing protein [Herbidospora sp. NEAU-GS84]|uniref:ATP-binding cassette domain-containing protein n=1 Tax=Herbidospora solisilvae TaxID=2696284 RepID=A0A7C9N0G1_9ACTN|nr:ABC transporter ATP-binding protein [Herbidospora solisilvae]NAS25711.1 ATP-binding cassette domain-containing protein [Herbidospora solisilvae]
MSAPPLTRPVPGAAPAAPAFRLLLTLLRPRRRHLTIALVWSLVEGLPAMVSGLLIGAAMDHGLLAANPAAGLGWLGLLGVAMIVKAAATQLMFPHLAAVIEPLRDDLITAVVTATVTRAATAHTPPDTAAVTRLTAQVETVRDLLSALLRSTRQLGISLIAALVGLLLLSPIAAAVVAVPVAVALLVFARLLRALVTRQRALVLTAETLTAQVTPILAGTRDVAACGAYQQAGATVREAVTAQSAATTALARAGTGRRLVVALGAHLPLLILLLTAHSLVQDGRLTTGEVVGAMTYVATGLEPAMRALTGVAGGWGVALAVTLRRLSETTAPAETTTIPAVTPSARPTTATPVGYRLQAEGLGFAYAAGAAPVVCDLTFTVEPGEHLVVAGPSGIGKSTLSLLLTGLRPPTAGRVRLGGVPLDDLPAAELRSLVALIPQEAYVFTGTLRENLAYLSGTDAGDACLLAAAQAVGADGLVERLGGLDATIDVPASLSAGERQLIVLARVHASPARVVVLDEATCHLDPAAEHRAETAFATRERTTLIVIAHRISSARRAGRVLLMDGAAVLLGTHADLVARSALYADLVGHWDDQG